jgi:hypothetical protein
MDVVLDRPMRPDQAQQLLGISLIQAKASDPIDHVVALRSLLLQGDAAVLVTTDSVG